MDVVAAIERVHGALVGSQRLVCTLEGQRDETRRTVRVRDIGRLSVGSGTGDDSRLHIKNNGGGRVRPTRDRQPIRMRTSRLAANAHRARRAVEVNLRELLAVSVSSLMLAFATSASAECAWVLWTQAVVGSTPTQPSHPIWGEWKPEETFQNRETCKRDVAKYLASRTRRKTPDDARTFIC